MSFLFCFSSLFAFEKAKKFEDYHFMLKAGFYPSFPFGDIISQEENFWELQVYYSDGSVKKDKPHVSMSMFQFELQYLIKNFGFLLSYKPIFISETVSVGDNESYENVSFSGDVIKGGEIATGLNYHFGTRIKGAPFLIMDFYLGVKGGFIWGNLIPYPSRLEYLKEAYGFSINPPTYNLYGYSVSPETGILFLFKQLFGGISFSYSYNNYFSSKSLSDVYSGIDKSFMLHYISIGVFAGIAF
jgi:hypothetical protein